VHLLEARGPGLVPFHLLIRPDGDGPRSTFQQVAVLEIDCIEGADQAIGGEQAKSQIIENGQGTLPIKFFELRLSNREHARALSALV
jgi:hypothetical protein